MALDTDGVRGGSGGSRPSVSDPLSGGDVFYQTGLGGCWSDECGLRGKGTACGFFFFRGKENASARQIDAIYAVYSGFSYLLWMGSLPSPPRGRADQGWAGTRGLRNSCSLATIFLSPRYLNASHPSPTLPFLCILIVFSPAALSLTPAPHILAFSFAPPLISPSITFCASVSIPCSPGSLCLLVPLPAFCPSHSNTAVSLCRRSGGLGAEEEGIGKYLRTRYPLPS